MGESQTITLALEPYFTKPLIIDGVVQTGETTYEKVADFRSLNNSSATAHFYFSGGCADVAALDWLATEYYQK